MEIKTINLKYTQDDFDKLIEAKQALNLKLQKLLTWENFFKHCAKIK